MVDPSAKQGDIQAQHADSMQRHKAQYWALATRDVEPRGGGVDLDGGWGC